MTITLAGQSDPIGTGRIVAPAELAEGTYRVRALQRVGEAVSEWSPELTVTVLAPIRRFEPAFWTIDLPLSASASLITTGSTGLRLACTLRTAADVVGMRWESEDRWSARGLGYFTSPNYTACILDFDFALTGLPPISDNGGLVMTVTDADGTDYFVRLANYMTSGDGMTGHIRLDFSGVPVLGGFNVLDEDQRRVIPWSRIARLSIGVAAPGYTGVADPIEPLDVMVELSNIAVSGVNTHVQRRHWAVAPHALRMTDGYDDAYNLTPERVVDGIWRLGYRDWYVIYVGASHLHSLIWDDAAGRLLVDDSAPVSGPARAWFADLFARLVARGFNVIISQSYEILSDVCPDAWQQRDHAGAGARTGWSPPSTLIAPTHTDALGYLEAVALWLCGALAWAGGQVRYQVGEPWWWDGSFTAGGPCIYDATTTALYTSETGQPVPTPYIQSAGEPVGVHGPYLDWLSAKLGASTLHLRDAIKAAYDGAQCLVLVFTPQILTPSSPLLARLNFPVASWVYPAWDVLQLEDYDWITANEWDLHGLTLTAGTQALGYPVGAIHYFAGFNLLPETAGEIWPRITQAASEAFGWGIAEVWVWARPQVWRDGWVYPPGHLVPALGQSPEAGPDPVNWIFPSDLAATTTTWGDVVLSWAHNGNDPFARVYTVDILDTDGEAVARQIVVTAPTVTGARVSCDYPVELSVPDFGFPPTFLAWRLHVASSTVPTGIGGALAVSNAAVRVVIVIAGQSNALGHLTTLSGADGRKDLVSAAALRRDLATRLGLRDAEVMVVQAAWGSSAADKHADDDPVSGVNYWWDLDEDEPGPRMVEFLSIVQELGVDPSIVHVVWAQGENDVSAFDPLATPRFSSPTRYRSATEAIFAHMRAQIGADLPIWIQTLGRAYWGDLPDPPEPTGAYYKTARDIQVSIAAADLNTKIGTWTPGAENIAGYVPEVGNPGFIHYTSAVYHAAALELSEAIATGLDRIDAPPAWTLLDAPAGLQAVRSETSNDIIVTWDALPGATWRLRNLSVTTGEILGTVDVTAPAWVFSEAEQVAVYDQLAGFVNINVFRIDGLVQGPAAVLVTEIGGGGGSEPAPTGLTAHHDGPDLVVTWDDVEGASWNVLNRNVMDNSELSTTTVTDPSWTFTAAAQTAVYGFPTSNLYVEVTRVGGGMSAYLGTVP